MLGDDHHWRSLLSTPALGDGWCVGSIQVLSSGEAAPLASGRFGGQSERDVLDVVVRGANEQVFDVRGGSLAVRCTHQEASICQMVVPFMRMPTPDAVARRLFPPQRHLNAA